ncbi:MAG TPA: nucleotide exchange factor GrpE [Bacteroides sp.]|nr:nucleotide exchange factor GrpE [Bacteroides sp.]
MTSKDKTQDQAVKGAVKSGKKTRSKTAKTGPVKFKTVKPGKKTDDSAKLKELQKEISEQKDKYIRLSADFDNFRKRTQKEKMDMFKSAGEGIFVEILPVLDDLERAMKFIDDAKDLDAVKEGMLLIYNKLKDYLNQQGVKEIEAMHTKFDTDVHEAVTQFPTKDKKLKGKVVDVLTKGYLLNDKVIRYSKVVIGN